MMVDFPIWCDLFIVKIEHGEVKRFLSLCGQGNRLCHVSSLLSVPCIFLGDFSRI